MPRYQLRTDVEFSEDDGDIVNGVKRASAYN